MRDWMEQARKKRGLTMRAAAAQLGISESYYSMIERGERQKKLDIALAARISNLFDISMEFIVKQESTCLHNLPLSPLGGSWGESRA